MLDLLSLTVLNVVYLLRAPIANTKKWEIFWAYVYLALRKLLIHLHLKKESFKVNFLNFSVSYQDSESYLCLFQEIFLENVYFFKSSKKNPLILDCGTNIGLAVLYFKYLYPQARIWCFEPDSQSLKILKQNINENHLRDIKIFPVALSNKVGKTTFFNLSGSQACTNAGLYVAKIYGDNFAKKEVKTDKLSKYIKEEVDFLKVDVEGAETDVFKDLETSKKMQFINQTIIEFHLNYFEKKPDLSHLLNTLENSNFSYHLHAIAIPLYQPDKIQNLMIYARKASAPKK